MRPMRVLVVDDEPPARARLRRLLDAIDSVEVVGDAADGEAAVARIAATTPDVVLLDISMPRLDGFDVIAALGPEMPLTIFCTAHDEHALAAFEARAVDYLLKPVQPQRLADALDRARRLLAGRPAARKRGLGAISAIVEERAPHLAHLVVHEGQRVVLLSVTEIDLIRAQRNVCDVRAGGRTFRVRRTLASIGARLDPARFLRVNKSDILRLDAVREIQPWSHGDYRVVLRDGTTLPWSRRFRANAPQD